MRPAVPLVVRKVVQLRLLDLLHVVVGVRLRVDVVVVEGMLHPLVGHQLLLVFRVQ